MRRVEGNDECADCKARDPTWTSLNLGVIICIDCSGIHRSMGTSSHSVLFHFLFVVVVVVDVVVCC